jgi:4-oxalocrotonate tautomerase
MPLVRISHASGKSQDAVNAISNGVHRALVNTFNVPEDDRFQIVTEHAAGTELVAPASFLGIEHTADMVFVQITCAEGRSSEQKRSLYEEIAATLSGESAVRAEDVIVNLVETKPENWSFGNGAAPSMN